MKLYDSVNGVHREVVKKYDPVNGAYRKVLKAFDSVDGVYRQYFSGDLTASALAVGDSLWLNMNGALKEFLIVHKGRPSKLYDASCDGVWLMEKIYTSSVSTRTSYAGSSDEVRQGYPGCRPHIYLNGTQFYDKMDSKAQAAVKQVKIPYVSYTTPSFSEEIVLKSGANGLSTKIFLPSVYELGWTSANESTMREDGACLDYFKGTAEIDAKRIMYRDFDGEAWVYWTRSFKTQYYVYWVHTNGSWASSYFSSASCVFRATFIIDKNTPIDNTTGINILA